MGDAQRQYHSLIHKPTHAGCFTWLLLHAPGAQLLACQAAIRGYLQRFSGVLAAANAQQLQLVLKVVAALLRGLDPFTAHQQQQQQQDQLGFSGNQRQPGAAAVPGRGGAGGSAPAVAARVCRVNDVLLDLGLDNVNLFPLLTWMREHKMVFKVRRVWGVYVRAVCAGHKGVAAMPACRQGGGTNSAVHLAGADACCLQRAVF
jgi:chromosome transmission fidelity protein 1